VDNKELRRAVIEAKKAELDLKIAKLKLGVPEGSPEWCALMGAYRLHKEFLEDEFKKLD
jgi:hypothetical protein